MGKYIIDFTECKMPPWWGAKWPLVLAVEDGKHVLEFDVIKSKIPPSVYRDMQNVILRRDAGVAIYAPDALTRPIGFNRRSLPKGAVITQCP